MADNREIYILYGSQTGNAESVAKDLSEKLSCDGIDNKCLTLNAAKKLSIKQLAKCLIVVCSTTGNADAPENADLWWRSVKLRSAAKDMFEGIPYTVLGLGDTNYDKFCFMGKAIDKRLSELGGKRLIEVYCADEATNLEEVVEAWKIAVMDLVKSFLPQDIVSSSSQSICNNGKVNDSVLVDDHDHNTTTGILVELVSEEIKNIEINDIANTIQDNVSAICSTSTGDITINVTTMDPLSV